MNTELLLEDHKKSIDKKIEFKKERNTVIILILGLFTLFVLHWKQIFINVLIKISIWKVIVPFILMIIIIFILHLFLEKQKRLFLNKKETERKNYVLKSVDNGTLDKYIDGYNNFMEKYNNGVSFTLAEWIDEEEYEKVISIFYKYIN